MKKKCGRKGHAKRNHNYKTAKANTAMKNNKQLPEVECMRLAWQCQNALGTAEGVKKAVHENMFDNLRVLMEHDGFDMSFMDDPVSKVIVDSKCKEVKTKIEENAVIVAEEFQENMTMYIAYSEHTEFLVKILNLDCWQSRFNFFLANYYIMLMTHYRDRDALIETLTDAAYGYVSEYKSAAYEHTINLLSIVVLDEPIFELSIVTEHIEKTSV